MVAKNNLATFLKLVVHDIEPKTMELTPSAPVSAYFIRPNYSTNKTSVVASYPSDMPGALFVIFKAEETFKIIADGMSAQEILIAFSRSRGGVDYQLTLDTSVESTAPDGKRTRSPKAGLEFLSCSQQLVTNLRSSLSP